MTINYDGLMAPTRCISRRGAKYHLHSFIFDKLIFNVLRKGIHSWRIFIFILGGGGVDFFCCRVLKNWEGGVEKIFGFLGYPCKKKVYRS